MGDGFPHLFMAPAEPFPWWTRAGALRLDPYKRAPPLDGSEHDRAILDKL